MEQQGSMQEDMSRLENLMGRIEGGQPYGDQTDIDMLLEEVVKRLENRVLSKIDDMLSRLPQGTPLSNSQHPKGSQPPKKVTGSKPKARLEPNMDLLNHEAQDLIQDVVMSSVDVAINALTDNDDEEPLWTRMSQTSADSSRAFKQKQLPQKVTPSVDRKIPTDNSTSGKPRGVITTDNVDSTYTYVLRNTVGRSIPKYLQKEGKSRAAVMHMFNDIRLSMADDSLEDIIVDALREAYLSQEDEERREIGAPKPRSISSPPTDRIRHDSESQSWPRRRSSSTLPSGVRHVEAPSTKGRQGTSDQGKGRQGTSNQGKGRQGTSDQVKGQQGTIVKQESFDVTKVRANQDKPRQVSDGWMRQDSDSSSDDIDKFYSTLDVDQFYTAGNKSDTVKGAKIVTSTSKKQVQFAKKSPSSLEDWKSTAQNMGDATLRHDSNLNYLVRRHVGRALPKFTYNRMVTRALTNLSEKLMDEIPLQPAILALNHDDVDFTSADKNAAKDVSKSGNSSKKRDDTEVPWVTKGRDQKSDNGRHFQSKGKTSQDVPWVTKGQNAKKGKDSYTASKAADDSFDDLPWVRRGNQDDVYTTQKRTTTPGYELPSRHIATQTSKRALNDCPDCNPYSVTAGRGFNKNTNQSGDSLTLSSQNDCTEDIFYDALCETPTELQITADDHSEEMSKSFLKRFRLNLLFRKQQQKKNRDHGQTGEKKFVSAVHKVIEARRSGCIDDDGNFVQSIPPPSPTNDGKKSPPAVKPKPKKTNKLDKNGNSVKRESGKRRGSSRRRHNPDRESYPLPEEDDGSEGYASASEMDDFNPTAFLERNRRSAENRYYREDDEEAAVEDDGDDADVESDSDGLNSPNRRVRFSDDVQHFGEIVALQETESTDNLDPEDDELDISRLSLKSKIELFEKVGSNEFLDDRSYQGSPPPDLPDTSLLPTKDRVKLFEDITSGKKPTTSAANHKTPRRAVDSCQFTLTASKISFFEELSGTKRD